MNLECGFRTKPKTLQSIKDTCLSKKAPEVLIEVTNEKRNEFPRNMDQIYKAKSRKINDNIKKIEVNIPEEFLKIQAMVNDQNDDFAQEYCQKKGFGVPRPF